MSKRKMTVKEVVIMADCYLGVVDWNKDYKHVLKVNSGSQFNDVMAHMNTHARKPIHITDVGIVKIDNGTGTIKADGYYSNFHIYNYILFRNDNNTNYYYAFIDSLEFKAPKTTHIHFSIDVWQMFSGSISFKNSFVERMHIAKNQDTIGRWLAPEPFSPEYEAQNQLQVSNLNFEPVWFLEALSKNTGTQTNPEWEYGGTGEGSNISPVYTFRCGGAQALQERIALYLPKSQIGETTIENILKIIAEMITGADHRKDIVSIYALPVFISNHFTSAEVSRNYNLSEEISFNLQKEVLASGYVPKNKKMFTSLAKQYIIYNRNGIQKPLKPEFILGNTLNLILSMKNIQSSIINVIITNYDTINVCSFDMPYVGSLAVGYNENAGMLKTMRMIKSFYGGIQNLVSGAQSLAGGYVTGGATGMASNASGAGNSIDNAFSQIRQGIYTYFVDTTAQAGGSSGDLMTLSQSMQNLRFIDCSPIYDKCVEIDNYLSTYGYAIQEFILPSITNRSNWNYLKGDINFTCNALGNDKQKLKDIFKNGVTVWRNPTNMLNYSLSNN